MSGPNTTTGRSAALRAATQRKIADDMAMQQAATAEQSKEFRRKDGTPIDVPTLMQDLVDAIADRMARTEVKVTGMQGDITTLSEAIERNTAITEKNAKDSAEILEIVRNAKGFGNTLKWIADLAKSALWVCVLLAAVGGMLYSQFFGPPPPEKTPRTASK